MQEISTKEPELLVEDNQLINCETVLSQYRFDYVSSDLYHIIGEPASKEGWIIHLSCLATQLLDLLQSILPEFASSGVCFKVIKDLATAERVQDGGIDPLAVGKLIAVYTYNETDAVNLTRQLLSLDSGFRGPGSVGDVYLGGIVYVRYGQFLNDGAFTEMIGAAPVAGESNIPWSAEVQRVAYRHPAGVRWPFDEFAKLPKTDPAYLLNGKYRPLKLLKRDPRGNVIKGIYVKGFLSVTPCVIKEAKKNMHPDDIGRCAAERLEWQYIVCKDVESAVPMPPMFDRFTENGSDYVVQGFVNGQALSDVLFSIYEYHSWPDLPTGSRQRLIRYSEQIVGSIESLHRKGYLHRDLSPRNFIVTKKDEIFLIDMELAYSLVNQLPTPAFQKGTPGHMSANQVAAGTPNMWDDVFGLAGLLLCIFTGLSPVRWEKGDPTHLQKGLAFFLQNPFIAEIIANQYVRALSSSGEPARIEIPLDQLKRRINRTQSFDSVSEKPSSQAYADLIQKGIDGLAAREIVDAVNGWVETTLKPDQSPSPFFVPQPGNLSLFNGTAGILYQLALCENLGFSVETCSSQINQGLELLKKVFVNGEVQPISFFHGPAGLRLVLGDIALVGKASLGNDDCLDIELGLAGELLSLLHLQSMSLTPERSDFVKSSLVKIINAQTPGGFWPLFLRGHKDILLGVGKGVAGILLVLLRYTEITPGDIPASTIEKGLNWIKKKLHKGLLPVSTGSREANIFSLLIGTPGIALVFLRAYRLTGNSAYKTVAEKILRAIPTRPNYIEHNLAFGLAGLGEVYLEAVQILGQQEWQSRADWLAQFFYHTSHHSSNGGCYWVVDKRSAITPGFMNGSCGILHFLTRYLYPEKVRFPIL